jgi:hypothetical protein
MWVKPPSLTNTVGNNMIFHQAQQWGVISHPKQLSYINRSSNFNYGI